MSGEAFTWKTIVVMIKPIFPNIQFEQLNGNRVTCSTGNFLLLIMYGEIPL